MTATEGKRGEEEREREGERELPIRNASSSKPFTLSVTDTDSSEELHICLPLAGRWLCQCMLCNLHLGDLQAEREGGGERGHFCLQPCCQINTVCVLPLTELLNRYSG